MTALRIHRGFRRPDDMMMAGFRDLGTGPTCDSQNRVGAISHTIKPVTSAHRMAGPAVVVSMGARDNLGAWAALEVVEPGDIIFLIVEDSGDCSVIGDVYVGMANNARAAGIVTTGLVRDVPGIEAVGIPVFAKGVSPNSPWKNGPAEVGLSAIIGDVTVASGDIAIADQDGVVIVKLESATDVLANMTDVVAKEAAMDRSVASGSAVPEWLEDAKSRLGVEYVG